MDKSEIRAMWCETSDEISKFFSELDADTFSAARGNRWSYAKNLDHLVRSVSPVVGAMRLPKLILRLLFGKGTTRKTYQQIHDAYKAELRGGAQAPSRFVPSNSFSQQQRIAKWLTVSRALEKCIEASDEQQLDNLRLPHPILGKITVREMLYFTDIHAQHHLGNCRDR